MKKIIDFIKQNSSLSDQEAWWVLEHITKKTRAELLLSNDAFLSQQELSMIKDWLYQLSQESVPLSYLLGSVPFFNMTIKVQQPILIPRPETEEWVASIIQELHSYSENIRFILEIGTGSGCISLALAKAFPNAFVTATDINQQALNLAQENAALHNIANITFIKSDLFKNIPSTKFDLIISNPPYIDPIHKQNMMPQVIKWEDERALFAQQEGLELIYKIIQEASAYLHPNRALPYQLVIEHDNNQQEKIKDFAQQHGFHCSSRKDLFGNTRTSWCKLR